MAPSFGPSIQFHSELRFRFGKWAFTCSTVIICFI